MPDDFDVDRLVAAQEHVIEQVERELRAGAKRSHWTGFVFPRPAGLGASPAARRRAVASLAEARAYLRHPVPGPRLVGCTGTVDAVQGRAAREIFGGPDDLEFRSCVTLFGRADPAEPAFRTALARCFGAAEDPRTVALLG